MWNRGDFLPHDEKQNNPPPPKKNKQKAKILKSNKNKVIKKALNLKGQQM